MSFLHSMTFDLISGLHMQIQTWHPPIWLCTHAKYYVKSGITNVLKNANKTKNMHFFFDSDCQLISRSVLNCFSSEAIKVYLTCTKRPPPLVPDSLSCLNRVKPRDWKQLKCQCGSGLARSQHARIQKVLPEGL